MRFSVIIPTFGRPTSLSECLAAVRALRPPPGGYEIVVVNDGGPSPPADSMRERGNALAITLVEQANAGPGVARNRGAATARGELLAFTDDDCQPDPDWLLELDAALARNPGALVGGCTRNALTDDVYAATSQLLVEFVTLWFDGGTAGRFLASSNLGVARRAFLDSGGFDPRFAICGGEDREFAERWNAAGRPTAVVPAATIQHRHHLTLLGMLRQHRTYGRGARTFRSIQSEAGRPVAIRPEFYLRSLLFPLQRGERRALRLALLTALCHGAYAVGLLGAPAHRPARRPRASGLSPAEEP